jgi:hypothetical protein
MKKKIARVVKQACREFWFPFGAALIWTYFRVSPLQEGFVANLIANFSTAFFLASWATGQFLRIARHQDVEGWFEELAREFNTLNETLAPVVRFATMMLERPRLDPDVRTAAESLVETAARITTAHEAFVQNSRLKQPWYLDQAMTPVPLRVVNLAGITQGPAEPPWPPPPDRR